MRQSAGERYRSAGSAVCRRWRYGRARHVVRHRFAGRIAFRARAVRDAVCRARRGQRGFARRHVQRAEQYVYRKPLRHGDIKSFHAGGIAATVDVETGRVVTDAADLDGNTYETNPYSGVKIKGFQIPHWDKVIESCKKANGRIEGVNLVGWDFAITQDGAELIEGNPIVSYILAQIPNVADKIGLKPVMYDPYMK